MSPKNKILRRVVNPPPVKGFKPYGPNPDLRISEPVTLFYEEYEAIRLCDYDGLNHELASIEMGISRPTFTRIYAGALQKLAVALVEGRQISIGGGQVYFDTQWYRCLGCGCHFNHPNKDQEVTHCPLCGDLHFSPIAENKSPIHLVEPGTGQRRGTRGYGRMRRRGQNCKNYPE
ncbi:MAG: DUF134 domain-containing protein [Bacteroidales bacterium]